MNRRDLKTDQHDKPLKTPLPVGSNDGTEIHFSHFRPQSSQSAIHPKFDMQPDTANDSFQEILQAAKRLR